MKLFKCYLQQEGGCDYTIGCGNQVITIAAKSMDEDKEKLFAEIEENYSHSESMLAAAEIYEVIEAIKVPIFEWYKKIRESRSRAKNILLEEKDRKEFERLKNKFS